jgi:hypothetical protein
MLPSSKGDNNLAALNTMSSAANAWPSGQLSDRVMVMRGLTSMLSRNGGDKDGFESWIVTGSECQDTEAYFMSYDHICEAKNLPTRACFHVVEADTSIKANASKHTDTNSRITCTSAGSRVEGGTHIKVISLFILLLRLEAIGR